MGKVEQGIYAICDALTGLSGAILVLCLIVIGISAMKNGADGKMKLKDDLIYVILGAGIVFTASVVGKTIMGWFM